MIKEFKLPELGEQIESGDLVKVLVSVGENIARDQPVLEIETEKADFEVPSAVAGRVREIHVHEGEKVKVGQLILTIDEEEEQAPAGEEKPAATAEEAKAPEEKREEPEKREIPEAPAGEKEERPPLPPEQAGILPQEQEEETAAPAPKPERAREEEVPPEPESLRRPVIAASPSIRRLAREIGVDIGRVKGTGPGGRISAEDVKKHAQRQLMERPAAGLVARPLPDFTRWGEVERKPMSAVRRKTVETMSYSWSTIPHVTQYDRADITELEAVRKRFGNRVEAAGGKLTVTSIAVKVIAAALDAFPQFAASVDVAREDIVFKKYRHIGVAVDTDRGLLVPVIRNADRKNILEIAVELTDLAERARSRRITPDRMEGGVFTITNLGGIGGTQFSPIVYAPEAAILGISRARLEPVFRNGTFEPRLMLPVSVSYDHRLIDGAEAARFLRWVAEALEQPFVLSLEG